MMLDKKKKILNARHLEAQALFQVGLKRYLADLKFRVHTQYKSMDIILDFISGVDVVIALVEIEGVIIKVRANISETHPVAQKDKFWADFTFRLIAADAPESKIRDSSGDNNRMEHVTLVPIPKSAGGWCVKDHIPSPGSGLGPAPHIWYTGMDDVIKTRIRRNHRNRVRNIVP